MLSSCSNRQLPFSGPVYRVLIAETSCAAVDLAFSGVPKYMLTIATRFAKQFYSELKTSFFGRADDCKE